MAALDASATLTALADMHLKPADDRLDRRHVYLILRRGVRVVDHAAAVGTGGEQRHVIDLVDHRRQRTTALAAVQCPWLATRPLRVSRRCSSRERRRLAVAGPPGKIEFFAQPLVFASQSCVVAFEPFDLRAQSGYFLSLLLNPFFGGLRFRPVGHATVMPELPIQYKSNRVEPGNQIRYLNLATW